MKSEITRPQSNSYKILSYWLFYSEIYNEINELVSVEPDKRLKSEQFIETTAIVVITV